LDVLFFRRGTRPPSSGEFSTFPRLPLPPPSREDIYSQCVFPVRELTPLYFRSRNPRNELHFILYPGEGPGSTIARTGRLLHRTAPFFTQLVAAFRAAPLPRASAPLSAVRSPRPKVFHSAFLSGPRQMSNRCFAFQEKSDRLSPFPPGYIPGRSRERASPPPSGLKDCPISMCISPATAFSFFFEEKKHLE